MAISVLAEKNGNYYLNQKDHCLYCFFCIRILSFLHILTSIILKNSHNLNARLLLRHMSRSSVNPKHSLHDFNLKVKIFVLSALFLQSPIITISYGENYEILFAKFADSSVNVPYELFLLLLVDAL